MRRNRKIAIKNAFCYEFTKERLVGIEECPVGAQERCVGTQLFPVGIEECPVGT